MTDPAFVVRAGQAGAILEGTPGNLLAFDATGKGLEGVPPPVVPPPPTPEPAVLLLSSLVPPWSGLATPTPDDDTFVTLPQFVSGLNERNPFLVTSAVDTMGGGAGADAALLTNGGTPQTVRVKTALALQVTFTSGAGQVAITAALFDELDNQLSSEGIFVFPTTAIVRLALDTGPFLLAANGKVFLKFKKNDANATVVSGVNLLGCATVVVSVP